MAYQRFLTDNDYLALVTEEGLNQLIRGNMGRLAQAEQRAEMKIVDYLDQFYMVGKELERGKSIKEYSNLVTYPSGAYFKKNGKIWRTSKSMNATHAPTDVEYWTRVEDLVMPAEQMAEERDKVLPYLQMKTYKPGDIVNYLGTTWRCLVANGWDFQNIQIPGIHYWKTVQVEDWIANVHYRIGDVVKFEDKYYAVIQDDDNGVDIPEPEPEIPPVQDEEEDIPEVGESADEDGTEENEGTSEDSPMPLELEDNEEDGEDTAEGGDISEIEDDDAESGIDWSDDPAVNNAFGLIGDYDQGYNYTVDQYDYVVYNDKVFEPTMTPNAEEPEEYVNIVVDDPRNYNLVNYMTAISLYYLNALIAPTNIPQSRIDMFEEAMTWVEAAARMKIDPHIQRKIDRNTHTPKDDWAMAAFETNCATQVNSPWFT